MTVMPLTLDDKYTVERGRVFLTGIQALVRLPMMQQRLDLAAGLKTAGFISGYRGSPLGGFDQQLWRAKKFLDRHNIVFKPGINEDLGATAVWGSQQVNLYPGAKFDGVFGMWYGKAPGVDRTGDVFKHANAAGTSRHGGVLAIAGDDHACKSSTLPSQSEFAFMDAEIPVLNPAGIQEVLDFGLYGWAMSRFSGTWTAMIALAENMDASATVDVAPDRVQIRMPQNFAMPTGGLSIRLGDTPADQERRLREHKLDAAIAFAHENVLNRVVLDSPNARIGLVASGKSYLDLRQALVDLGIGNKEVADLGLRIFKVGMPWPLERDAARRFADGLESVFVIEEKRDLIETQFKSAIYDLPESRRPRVIGKLDQDGKPLLRTILDLNPAMIAQALSHFIPKDRWTPRMQRDLDVIMAKAREVEGLKPIHERIPFYCSGCPHNTSTKVPEGQRAMAGIGCHYMVTRMDRATDLFTQMGGEGVPWIGQEPFTDHKHMFANLGDGTYFHSGILAIRQAVSAKANITYKILYNDAVAMTGGQPVDGELPVGQLLDQVAAEGVQRIVLVADDPDKYPGTAGFPHGVKVEHRERMDAIQRELSETPGVTVLVYDQTCAAEKRRRRKRGLMEDPPKRVFINEEVCEGCGDCTVKSNCLSVEPLETEFGRKRQINQSSCNKDYSCLSGFCPSFVTVEGGKVKSNAVEGAGAAIDVPEPVLAVLADDPFNMVITGIGGTGVTSIGAILGTAAHVDGKAATVLDMMGLAQKGGGVTSYVRVAASKVRIHGPRVATASADLILACDMVVASKPETIDTTDARRTHAIVNDDLTPTAGFIKDNAISYDARAMKERLKKASRDFSEAPADELAVRLLGDAIFSNMMLVGYAWQKGTIPIARDAILRAIELNGAEVKKNIRAFELGRLAAHDFARISEMAGLGKTASRPIATALPEIIARRASMLTAYQNKAYADRYVALVERVKAAEARLNKGTALTEAVARAWYKLLAYKDEYEVARLYTDGNFTKRLAETFDGKLKLNFHMSPPMIAPKDPDTGLPKKITIGPWMMGAFKVLAKMKRLRGTPLDLFGYSHERRTERALIKEYEARIAELLAALNASNHATAVAIAGLPMDIKGFGHIKDRNLKAVRVREEKLLSEFRNPSAVPAAAKVAAE